MTSLLIDTALAAYALVPPVEVFALPAQGRNNRAVGVRTGAGDFIFKTYLTQGEAALRYEYELLRWLAATGLSFAVPMAVATRTGDALLPTPDGWATLAAYLPGRPVQTNQLGQVEAMGAALAQLHQALAGYQPSLPPSQPSFGAVVVEHAGLAALTAEQIGQPAPDALDALLDWWRQEHRAVSAFVAGPYASLPQQVIHSDFNASNTLIDGERVTAVLDFEFAGPDARAVDVASALKFTLRVWENAEPWPRAAAFCRGYGRVQRLTEGEINALPWLTRVRDTAVTLLRLERAIADGDLRPLLGYLQQAQASALWLEQNGTRLAATAAAELE